MLIYSKRISAFNYVNLVLCVIITAMNKKKEIGSEWPCREPERFRRLLRLGFAAILLLFYAVLFYTVWRRYYSSGMHLQYYRRGHYLLLAFYVLFMHVMVQLYGGWKVGYLRRFNLFLSHAISIIIVNTVTYAWIVLLTLHFQQPWALLCVVLLELILSYLWSAVTTHLYQKAYPARDILMIYGDRPEQLLQKKLSDRQDRFVIRERLSIELGIEELQRRIPDFQGVVLGDLPAQERNDLLKFCYENSIRCYLSPKVSDLILRGAEEQHMFDTPLMMVRGTGLTIESSFIKRCIDIVISALLLLLVSPLMLIVALCIHLEDRGPVFYSQERLSQNRRVFRVYKFRSMKVDAESDGIARLASQNDDRVTRVGAVIRRHRIDELPQLWNVFKGEMSLVGPRPERPEISADYEKKIPEFSYRMKVKAGLTGYAQVYGKYNTTAYDKLKLDLMYINGWSLMLDLEILLKTIQTVLIKENTDGIEDEEQHEAGDTALLHESDG